MEYLVIDGYNVINAWSDLLDLQAYSLEHVRDKLLSMLSNYQGVYKKKIIVVFDAHMVKDSKGKRIPYDNLQIVFTKENETADNYIEKFVHKYGNIHTIRVVTSDYMEQTIVMSNGGIRITPKELKQEISTAVNNMKPMMNIRKSNDIASRMSPELLEKLEKIRRS